VIPASRAANRITNSEIEQFVTAEAMLAPAATSQLETGGRRPSSAIALRVGELGLQPSSSMRRWERMLLRLAFLAWKSTSQELVIDYLEKENHKLSQEIGRRQTSIWAMRKDELVKKAREEMGMSHADAEA